MMIIGGDEADISKRTREKCLWEGPRCQNSSVAGVEVNIDRHSALGNAWFCVVLSPTRKSHSQPAATALACKDHHQVLTYYVLFEAGTRVSGRILKGECTPRVYLNSSRRQLGVMVMAESYRPTSQTMEEKRRRKILDKLHIV